MEPLAIQLEPSPFPYQFTELINLRGDFDQAVKPGEVVNPKGIAYHPELDRLIVSLSPAYVDPLARAQVLKLIDRNGQRTGFAGDYQMFRRVESKIAIVPASGPPVAAGFRPGDIFVGRGPDTQITQLNSQGEVIFDIFAEFLEGIGGGVWGGLCFDTEGLFGGRLIAVEANGAIALIDHEGTVEILTDLKLRLEGAIVAPASFGPLGQQLLVGVEGYSDFDVNGGEIYAINANGQATLLANIGSSAEDLRFIPPMGGTYYQCELSFERERENRIMTAAASQFLNRLGRLVVVNELTGELFEIAWDGSRYTQQNVGRVPGRWSTTGFIIQGTELESGCFAVSAPVIPDWQNWAGVPGDLLTDRAPAATADVFGEIVVLTNNQTDRGVYANRLQGGDRWKTDWEEPPLPTARLTTPHALACCSHNASVYAFAVRSDGRIAQRIFANINGDTNQSWQDVPGGLLSNTTVSSTVVNGRLVLCALGQDQNIYLNELAPGGRTWAGWYQIPGGGRTNVTPTVAGFQDELYVFIKGLTSRRILVKTRTIDGFWLPWAELPGAGKTDVAITAISAGEQLYAFSKLPDSNFPQVNVASKTGTWSGWLTLPNSGATDTSLAAANLGERVYLFAKGINDRRLYMRNTV